MSFSWVEYTFPYPFIFHKEILWIDKDCHCYFSFRLTESDSWTYFAGSALHNLTVPGQLLTAYGSESEAQTHYFSTQRSLSGKVMAVLPVNMQAKYARLHIEAGNNVQVREWHPSVYVTAHDIISGTLEITDLLTDAPIISVTKGGQDRIVIGNFTGSTYGIVGYDGSGNTIFELSDAAQNISGWDINTVALTKDTGIAATSAGLAPADFPFYAGAEYADRATAPFRVSVDGILYAEGAVISGTMTAIAIDIGGNDDTSFHVDIDGNMWAGDLHFAHAPFSVTNEGELLATNATLVGSITANTGYIGGVDGWVIATGKITSEGTGIATVEGDPTYAFWAGDNTSALADFSVSHTGMITANSGLIGGNVLGPFSISSPSFISGPLGSGWKIENTGKAEFQNISVRGVIKSAVFEKDTISAINGMVLVTKSDVLFTDMTADDICTLTVTGETDFEENEVIRLKDGTNDEWMLVVSRNVNTYTVTRDLVGSYDLDDNPVWTKGTAVVSMGRGTVSLAAGTGRGPEFAKGDFTSDNAFIEIAGINLSFYIGRRIVLRDSAGRIAEGFISAASLGEELSEEIIIDGSFSLE